MLKKTKIISTVLAIVMISTILISCVKLQPQRELELQQWGNEKYTYSAKYKKDGKIINGTFTMTTERINKKDIELTSKENEYTIKQNNFYGTLFKISLTLEDEKIEQFTYLNLDSKPILTRAYYKTKTEHKDVLIKYSVKRKKNVAIVEKADYYLKDYNKNNEVKKEINLSKSQIYIDNATLILMAKSIMNISNQTINFNTINPLNYKLNQLTMSPKGLKNNDEFISKRLKQEITINGKKEKYLLNPQGIGVCDINLNQKKPPANTPIITLYVTNGAAKYKNSESNELITEKNKDGKEINKIFFFQSIKYKNNDGDPVTFKNYSIPVKITSTLANNSFLELELTELEYNFN